MKMQPAPGMSSGGGRAKVRKGLRDTAQWTVTAIGVTPFSCTSTVVDAGLAEHTGRAMGKGAPIAKLEIGEAGASSPTPCTRSTTFFTTTLLLMVFFESINPPESYIHQFLDRAKHLPEGSIPRFVIPFFTYGQLFGFLPLTLLSELADKCCYVIALGLSLRIGSSLLHLLGPAERLLPHQIARGMYGLASAGKVSIKSHAYANLPRHAYISITGYMRAVNLVAHVLGGSLGYAFYSNKLDWAIAFSVQIGCLLVAIFAFVGNIACSTFSNKDNALKSSQKRSSFQEFLRTSWATFRGDRALTAITIWVITMEALALCFQSQKSSLIHTIDKGAKSNGLAVAGCRLSSALITFCIGRYPSLTRRFRVEWLFGAALAISLVTFMAGYASNVFILYSAFLVYGLVSDAFICIATAHIALASPSSIRGWILFGNQFLSIVLASWLQLFFGTILSFEIRWIYFGLAIVAFVLPIVLMPLSCSEGGAELDALA